MSTTLCTPMLSVMRVKPRRSAKSATTSARSACTLKGALPLLVSWMILAVSRGEIYREKACLPSFVIIGARNTAMSGSSSTTSTRNRACAGARWPASAISLISDLYLRQVVAVILDMRLEGRLVAAARAVLDVLAEERHPFEAVGIAHAAHAVPELA